jgi:glycosyltransferase involved in cell wall biosynthesis
MRPNVDPSNDLPGAKAADDTRPVLAIVANALPPYRLHFHQRVAREIPEMKLATVLTHESSNSPWALKASDEIGSVLFGPGESSIVADEGGRKFHEWLKGGRIVRWLKEQRLGAVLVNGYNDPGRLRILRWCHRNRVPVLLFGDSNIHGDRATGLKAKLKRRLLRRVLGNIDAVLACGSLGRVYFEKYGVRTDDLFYSPYEPNYELIQGLSEIALRDAARRFGLRSGRRRIVFSGRLKPVKRPELLVQAFVAIADQRANWDLVMIGDGPMRDELKRMVPAELTERVIWTGFLDDQATVSALYRNCDVLALPSDYEPWALVINEAVAAGLAVVCSDVVGAAAELVTPGVNGEKFPAGSPVALKDALLRVTDASRVDSYKAGSAGVLETWRQSADPVLGLRAAIAHATRRAAARS